MNILALNLSDDIIHERLTGYEARMQFSHAASAMITGNITTEMEAIKFKKQTHSTETDSSVKVLPVEIMQAQEEMMPD